MKIKLFFPILFTLLLNTPAKPTYFNVLADSNPTTDMTNVSIESGESFDTNNIFYDDFSSSRLDSNWVVSHRKWGANDNKGVSADNVFLNTKDDKLIIRALGNQHLENSTIDGIGGPLSGGAIVLKDTVRPGRFEVRMKTTYRAGICAAFWTYTEDGGGNNHEIDIELPPRSGNTNPFDEVLFTNWVSGSEIEQSQHKLSYYLNDGEYHTFAFDWYYSKNHKQIDYFIDGVKLASHKDQNFVPYLPSRLWLGAWIPNNEGFVGLPNFDTSYMEIDYVKYSPFLNQETVTLGTASGCGNTSLEYKIITEKPRYEWISNGTFHSIAKSSSISSRGYSYTGNVTLSNNYGYLDTSTSGGAKLGKSSSITYKIDSVPPEEKFTFEANFKGKTTAKLNYFNRSGVLFDSHSIQLENTEWDQLTYNFLTPKETYYMEMVFETSNEGEVLLDNLSMYMNDYQENIPDPNPGEGGGGSSSSSSVEEPGSSSTGTGVSSSSQSQSSSEKNDDKESFMQNMAYIGIGALVGSTITTLIFLIFLLSKKK